MEEKAGVPQFRGKSPILHVPLWALLRKTVNDTFDSIQHRRRSEVQDQPDAAIGDSQICVELSTVNGRDRVQRLHLQDDRLFDDNVRTIGATHGNVSIDERQDLLCFDPQSGRDELEAKAFEVRAFEQTRSDCPMNTDGGINNG